MKISLKLYFVLGALTNYLGIIKAQQIVYDENKKDKTEELALNEIRELYEVKDFFRETRKELKPALDVEDTPEPGKPYYVIKAGLSNGDMFRTLMRFSVHLKTLKVYYWDIANNADDNLITIQQWRKWRSNPRFNQLHIFKNGKLVLVK